MLRLVPPFARDESCLDKYKILPDEESILDFETTLSGRSYLNVVRDLKERHYKIPIYFLWAPTVELTRSRVKQRVLEGGHDIPEIDQTRRFPRSFRNFLVHYRLLADAWTLFDNSGLEPVAIAEQDQGEIHIIKPEMYRPLVERYGQPE